MKVFQPATLIKLNWGYFQQSSLEGKCQRIIGGHTSSLTGYHLPKKLKRKKEEDRTVLLLPLLNFTILICGL